MLFISCTPLWFQFSKNCILLAKLWEKFHSEQLWWGSQLAVPSQLFPVTWGKCHQTSKEILLIFHVRILPLILKMCMCFCLVSSKTGGLFPLKCLVSWFIYFEMFSQGTLFPKPKTFSAFLLPSFLCQPGSICSFKQTSGYSELLPHQPVSFLTEHKKCPWHQKEKPGWGWYFY